MKTVKCTCKHEFQDSLYGAGNRMANENRSGQYRCTVCGTLHGSASMVTASKKAKEPEPEPVKKEPEKKPEKKPVKKDTGGKKDAGKSDKKDKKKASAKGGKR